MNNLPDKVTIEYLDIDGAIRKHRTRGNWDVVVARWERLNPSLPVVAVGGGW